MKQIDSRQNERFKRLKAIVSSASERREQQMAWIEGDRLCAAYLQARQHQAAPTPSQPCVAVYAQSHPRAEVQDGQATVADEIWVLDDRLFAQISDVQTPSGWGLLIPIPAGHQPGFSSITEDALVLDRIQDPGNAGTLLRTAAAAGIAQVIGVQGTVDLWAPKVLRSAMGAHFRISITQGLELDDAIQKAKLGRQLLATSLNSSSLSLYAPSLDLTQPTAWVFGQESSGVSPDFLQQGLGVFIPQDPQVESLNVAAAAAICLFEARRQRLGASPSPAKG